MDKLTAMNKDFIGYVKALFPQVKITKAWRGKDHITWTSVQNVFDSTK